MTAAGWIEIALFFAILTALTPCSAPTWRASTAPNSPPARRPPLYRALRRRPRPGLEGATRARCSCSPSCSGMAAVPDPAHAGHPSVQPATAFDSAHLGRRRSTPTSSFVTNTNWQYYGGETTLSYFSQMAGLAVQNFVSAAVGIAVAIALHPRHRRRAPARRARQLLASTSSRTIALRAAADLDRRSALVPRLAGRRSQTLLATSRGPVSLAGGRSSCSAPTAAASSTSTRRIPFENPTWLTNFVEMLLDPR